MGHVDVRDVAAAMVSGIKLKGNHRLLLTGEWFDWADAVDYIKTIRPELEPRLAKIGSTDQKRPIIDSKKALEVLGITLTPWRKTVSDGLDAMLKVEEDWIKNNVDPALLTKNEWTALGKAGANTTVKFADEVSK